MPDSAPSDDAAPMTAEAFRRWRKALGLTQRDAAGRLGLKKRIVQYYERGDRDGRPVAVPRAVRLACWALASGIGDYDGERALPLADPAAEPDPAP